MEKMDKIQIGHVEVMQSIGMSTGKVGNHLLGMSEIAQGSPYTLRIVIALSVDQVFQPMSLLSGVNNIIYFVLLVPIFYNV